jgi:hypothetical protein
MEHIDKFYGYFNILLGTVFILLGFKIYKPFRKDNAEAMYKKYVNLFRFGGIALLIWGLTLVL